MCIRDRPSAVLVADNVTGGDGSSDTITFPENLEHKLESSMTGEAALYRIIATDDPAGPTWRQ